MIRKQLFITPNNIPSLIVLTESLLCQKRFIDAEAFINRAEQLDISSKYSNTIKRLNVIIKNNYKKRIIHE